jgi:hypothetical protein
VPALVVDGRVLTQSPAIIEWLKECNPSPPLLPTDIPVQWRRIASRTSLNRYGDEVGLSSSLRTCRCTSVAPASYDAWVDSTGSATLMGTAVLSFLRGNEPVIATEMMQGV